jgi:hypothetical protein
MGHNMLVPMATKSIARTGSWQRLVGRGKPPKLALTACIGKLLVILNAALRDRRPWREPGMPRPSIRFPGRAVMIDQNAAQPDEEARILTGAKRRGRRGGQGRRPRQRGRASARLEPAADLRPPPPSDRP